MTAALKIKNNRYYAVINYKDNGEYRQKWIALKLTVKNNKRKAEAMLDKIKQEYEELYSMPDGDMPFVAYIRKWLKNKKQFVELPTWESYKIYAESHVIPYFEPMKLSLREVQPQHIKDYYDYKYTRGRLDGQEGGLSIISIKKHSVIIKEALGEAFLEGLILRNPAVGVKLPAKAVKMHENVFLTAQEANRMLRCFDGHHLKALIYTTLYYGLRRSEILGLRWSAIDFEKNTITINHAVVKHISVVRKDKTKTASSRHTYILIKDVKEALLKQREIQQNNRKAFGSSYIESDYVFTWSNGKLFAPDYITRAFQKVLADNDMPKMRFHDLRHSTASVLYDKGWDLKDIQSWLRHSNISVTADVYTHISEDRKAVMANSLSSTFELNPE